MTLSSKSKPKLTKVNFQIALHKLLSDAAKAGEISTDVRAATLHNIVGGYPGIGHSMPTCCAVMYDEYRPGDEILAQPPKGKGASVLIRYQLPR